MPFAPRLLDEAALRALGMDASGIVSAVRNAVRDSAEGRLLTAPKSVLQPGDGRYMMTTLASGDVTVVKAVSVCPENPSRGLPSITGAILVLDAETGECRALMDAQWVTAVRTAGLSAVAADVLADPQSRVMSFVGCGVQARSHLEMFASLYPLTTIRAYGRGSANIDRLCAMARELGLDAEVAQTPEAALDGADIVVSSITITYDGPGFLDARRLGPGSFAAITDAAKPWIREGLEGFATRVVDDRAQEAAMPDPMVPPDAVSGDLSDLVCGRVAAGAGPRAFLFRGIAAGDYALASQILQKVERSDG